MSAEIQTIAREFASNLREAIGTLNLAKVVDANLKVKAYRDDTCCASHEFCDANVYMLEAFETVMRRLPDPASQSDADLLNEAWSMAKAANFYSDDTATTRS